MPAMPLLASTIQTREAKMLPKLDRDELCDLLTIAAKSFAAIRGPIWSSFDSGAEIAGIVLDCRDAIAQDAISPSQMEMLVRIFAPTCDWDDVVGDVELGNAIYSILERYSEDANKK